MATKYTFEKDPNAVLDYELDWTAWLGTDTINSATWTYVGTPTGQPTLSSQTIVSGKIAKIWASGGELGQDYPFRCRIVTTGGRTDDRTVTFKIRDK